MQMSDSKATKSQLNFIKRLRDSSNEREEAFQSLLKDREKLDVGELSIQEASEVIDALKKIVVEGDNSTDIYATGKQIDFISRLQDTEERVAATKEQLEKLGKESINHLSIQEASELIDKLIKMTGPDKSGNYESMATSKQIKFIKNLQKSEKQLELARSYLKEIKKENFDELTRKEASELINKLKE